MWSFLPALGGEEAARSRFSVCPKSFLHSLAEEREVVPSSASSSI